MKEEDCDAFAGAWGKCDPRHPIHCCHFIVTTSRPSLKPGWVLLGYSCKKGCGKVSKVWTLRKESEGTGV